MSTCASLVVGADGSTSKAGSSRGVGSSADRSVFLARRAEFDVIIIGGNTARNEPYTRTPVALVVLSRSDTIQLLLIPNRISGTQLRPKLSLVHAKSLVLEF